VRIPANCRRRPAHPYRTDARGCPPWQSTNPDFANIRQVAHAPERSSHEVTIAGRGHRARSVMGGSGDTDSPRWGPRINRASAVDRGAAHRRRFARSSIHL
jgi:hypothetical protein